MSRLFSPKIMSGLAQTESLVSLITYIILSGQGPLLLTWFNFKPSMDK